MCTLISNVSNAVQTRLQQMVWDGAEISQLFRKDMKLDKKDMVYTQLVFAYLLPITHTKLLTPLFSVLISQLF